MEFDVDRYLAEVDLQDVLLVVYRKGQVTPRARRHPATQSGFNLSVSEAEFSDAEGQIEDARAFLARYERELAHLKGFPGVEDIVLDFPIEDRDVASQADFFPSDLLGQMGALGIGLEVTRYPRPEPGTVEAADR